jgi:hypothetical protein
MYNIHLFGLFENVEICFLFPAVCVYGIFLLWLGGSYLPTFVMACFQLFVYKFDDDYRNKKKHSIEALWVTVTAVFCGALCRQE